MLNYKRSNILHAVKNWITFWMFLNSFKFNFKCSLILSRFLSRENLGQSSKECSSILISVPQDSRSGGNCFVIRYSCISLEWPVRMRVRAAWFFLVSTEVLGSSCTFDLTLCSFV